MGLSRRFLCRLVFKFNNYIHVVSMFIPFLLQSTSLIYDWNQSFPIAVFE